MGKSRGHKHTEELFAKILALKKGQKHSMFDKSFKNKYEGRPFDT